jgi:hypothetical protein
MSSTIHLLVAETDLKLKIQESALDQPPSVIAMQFRIQSYLESNSSAVRESGWLPDAITNDTATVHTS